MSGVAWVIANRTETRFRGWGDVGFTWVNRKDDAIWYARRDDAEKVAAEDIDAWLILPIDELAFQRDRLRVEFDILKTAAERDHLLLESEHRLKRDAELSLMIVDLQAERDRLRAEVEQIGAMLKEAHDKWEEALDRWEALRAEKAELVAAIKQVEAVCGDNAGPECNHAMALNFVWDIARAAHAKVATTEDA